MGILYSDSEYENAYYNNGALAGIPSRSHNHPKPNLNSPQQNTGQASQTPHNGTTTMQATHNAADMLLCLC